MVLQDSLTDTFFKSMLLPESGVQSHASNLLMLENGDVHGSPERKKVNQILQSFFLK